MSCRTGCKTKDHLTYADCLIASNVVVNPIINSPMQEAFEGTRKDLSAYRTARLNGIRPSGTSLEKVRAAENASRGLGRPYDCDKDPPANMIVSKNAARFVNAEG